MVYTKLSNSLLYTYCLMRQHNDSSIKCPIKCVNTPSTDSCTADLSLSHLVHRIAYHSIPWDIQQSLVSKHFFDVRTIVQPRLCEHAINRQLYNGPFTLREACNFFYLSVLMVRTRCNASLPALCTKRQRMHIPTLAPRK